MNTSTRIALLAAAAIVAAGGIAAAPLTGPVSNGGHARGHAGSRLFAEYDLNHDGKITRDEANRVAAERFAAEAGGAGVITERQFADAKTAQQRDRAARNFKRLDWNGDGKLSLAEYSAYARETFGRMDRNGEGTISCVRHTQSKPADAKSHRRSGTRGSSFCASNDLNNDGKLTRAELDASVAKKFAAATQGGAGLTPQQFFALSSSRNAQSGARGFARLDTNKDGKLTKDEFAADTARLFARLDTNKDGTITKDEAASHRGRSRTYGKPEHG